MKVISTSPSFGKYSNAPIETLEKNGITLVSLPADITIEALKPHLADADAMIVAFTDVRAPLLDMAPKMKIVCKHGVGVDNIDLDETKKRDVWVTNVPNANKHAVADFTFSLLLSLAKQIPFANDLTKKGEWPRVFAADVWGKTLGIVGLGNIGKQVAMRAKGFNMRVIAHDFYQDVAYAKEHGIEFLSKEDLLQQSDYVTLHMPLTDQTKNFIGASDLQKMNKGAFLINASRGGVVNELELYEALKKNVIAGAASDVFEQEPLKEHPLFTLDNFIATPHIAGYTDGAVNAIGEQCVENIVKTLVGKQRPDFVMNGL